jgi:steroid 5-alpha reductase family enzyme
MNSSKDLYTGFFVVTSVLVIMGLVASAIGINSVNIGGFSTVILCAVIAIGIQWLSWIPASIKQTERFFDATGGVTYLVVIIFSLWAGSNSESPGSRELIVSVLVAIWSLRLTSFLFLRIHRTGKDGRFDDLKNSPVRFIIPWTLQGLWIFLTMSVVIVINSQSGPAPDLSIWDGIGMILWIIGFGIEVVADKQKTTFNSKPENRDRWIDEGLWSVSRHPNYLGEILLWTGIAFFGVSCFEGLEMVAWTSPVFTYILLTRISGIPILDQRAKAKWENNPDFQQYRTNTPALIPRPRRDK